MTKTPYLLLAASATLVALPLSAQRVLNDSFGTHGDAQYGASLARVNDVTGDGIPELVVGSPNYSASPSLPTIGRVQVINGWNLATLHTIAPFGTPGTRFGTVVLGTSDLNGDGRADYVVGSPDLLLSTNNYGVVTAHDGLTGGTLWTSGVSGTNLRRYGAAITQIGDLSGDGTGELIVGYTGAFLSTGVIRIDGRTGALGMDFWQGTVFSECGASLITLSDMNLDGQPEFLIGEPRFDYLGQSGRVIAINPTSQQPWLNTFFIKLGPNWNGGFGYRLANVGDLNGDGKDDFLSSNRSAGVVHVCSGTTGQIFGYIASTASNSGFGEAISRIGDFDGDGREDFAVGSPNYNNGGGRVDVYSGRTLALISSTYGQAGSRFGCSIAPFFDVDSDGRADFAVGARDHVVNGVSVGRVAVIGIQVIGDATSFGVGCSGQPGAPTLGVDSGPGVPRPMPGVLVRYLGGNLGGAIASLWIWGFSASTWGSVPLPVDLAVIGVPGCNLLVSPDIINSSPGGIWWADLQLPNNSALVGQHLFLQVAGLGSAYPNGFAVSPGLDTLIGNVY